VDGAPHIGPTWARLLGSRVPLEGGGSVIVDEAYLTESMMDPLARVRRGYQPVMPAYRGILSATEAGALVELIRSLRDLSPEVQPSPPPVPAGPGDGLELRVQGAPAPQTAPEPIPDMSGDRPAAGEEDR
jgi:cytochrome c oxidase subunit 2